MLYFIIPVKSKKITKDWEAYTRLVERSVRSTCNQNNLNFGTLVVCNEIPEISFESPKIHFLQVDWDAPTLGKNKLKNSSLGDIDKGKKILKATEYAQKLGATYIMTVDSDDCVSNKLAEFVQTMDDVENAGWYVKKGFVYKEASKIVFLNRKNFNDLCGTSVIIRPNLVKMMFSYEPHLYFLHKRKELSNGQKLEPLPFPGAIYSVGNGENQFMSMAQVKETNNHGKIYDLGVIRLLLKKAMKYRPKLLGKKIKTEFTIYAVT